MKKQRRFDEDMPVGNLRIIPDFLPSPEEIARSLKRHKVTLLLEDETIDFFKEHARKHSTRYQQMMREVLRHYTRRNGEARQQAARRPKRAA